MKFAVIAALFAAVSAKGSCDTTKMSFKWFNDEWCKKPNKEWNKNAGTVPDDYAYLYDDTKCQTYNGQGKYSWKMHCDKRGMHEEVWDNEKCNAAAIAKIHFDWDECSQVPG